LHSRLDNFHSRNFETLLALVKTSEDLRGFRLSQKKRESCQIATEVMFENTFSSLPTSSDGKGRVESLGRVEWPVVNNFRVALVALPGNAINPQLNVGEDHGNCVVMPFIVANLKNNHQTELRNHCEMNLLLGVSSVYMVVLSIASLSTGKASGQRTENC
jgi:hypothetical protein